MGQKPTAEEAHNERECVHRRAGVEGGLYRGDAYVAALQRLGSRGAMKMAGKVGPFFWSDAPRVRVWLCTDCAREAGVTG